MAIREDELAASLMGVPLMRTKLWSYAVGAVAGGVGGAFYATIVGTVNVDNFTFQFSIIILCAVILGGMGNFAGAIVGAGPVHQHEGEGEVQDRRQQAERHQPRDDPARAPPPSR